MFDRARTDSGSEYARILIIPGFCMSAVLNMPGFWISQGSEYTSGSEICLSSEYTGILNTPELHRVLNMSK